MLALCRRWHCYARRTDAGQVQFLISLSHAYRDASFKQEWTMPTAWFEGTCGALRYFFIPSPVSSI